MSVISGKELISSLIHFVDFRSIVNMPDGCIVDICGLVTRFGLCYGERIEEQDFIVLRQIGGDVEMHVEKMKLIRNDESVWSISSDETVIGILGVKIVRKLGSMIYAEILEDSIFLINCRNCHILPVEMDNWMNNRES